MWGEKKTNSWKTVTAGEELTRLFWQEVKQKNWTEVSNHMSATVVGLNSNGTLDRDGMLSHFKKMDLSDFQIGEVQTQTSGEHLLVTYTLAARGTIEGHPLPATTRYLSVWQLVKSGWVLVAQSAVPVEQS
jgi:ketosteroid isomerase-like protein